MGEHVLYRQSENVSLWHIITTKEAISKELDQLQKKGVITLVKNSEWSLLLVLLDCVYFKMHIIS